MKIYHAPNTRSVRIVWLMEELGLPYELERFKLGDPGMRAPQYLKLNPMGRVPTLVDGDVTISESGAIVQYVLARHGRGALAPAEASPEFPRYLQWLHYAEGMIMPPVNTIIVETILLPASARWGTLSSTMVREVASLGGDVTAFVPALVAERIAHKRTATD